MSIPLTSQVLSIQVLTQIQKHILTVLCFIADSHHEVYRSIKNLSLDCSCSIKTIERTLMFFRDNGYLTYTGKLAPNSRSIPIYSIDLNHGLTGGDKELTTDSQSLTDGLSGVPRTPSKGIRIDNIYKDNKKDIFSSFSKDQLKRWKKERELQKERLK